MRYLPAIPLLLCLCLLTPGCSRAIVQADNPAPVATDQYRQTFQASVDVLRDLGFTIDRRDYRFGKITTLPIGSPNIFEVWNPHNTTRQQAIESTLASEQRRVNITLTPADQPSQPSASSLSDSGDSSGGISTAGYTLQVEVILERRQIPTRRLAGSARRNVFSNLAAPPKSLLAQGVTGNYWEVVGTDPHLEARLVKEITERADRNE